jgi:hypothetical protein
VPSAEEGELPGSGEQTGAPPARPTSSHTPRTARRTGPARFRVVARGDRRPNPLDRRAHLIPAPSLSGRGSPHPCVSLPSGRTLASHKAWSGLGHPRAPSPTEHTRAENPRPVTAWVPGMATRKEESRQGGSAQTGSRPEGLGQAAKRKGRSPSSSKLRRPWLGQGEEVGGTWPPLQPKIQTSLSTPAEV